MRRLIWLLPILLLCGCKGDYPWRDEHRGTIKHISGFGMMMVVEFQDGAAYRIPLQYISESTDPWGEDQEIIIQTRVSDGPPPYWRFRSTVILEPGTGEGLPAERTTRGGQ